MRWVVVESTSHGLAQLRVSGVAYDVAVLTNVTSEHLEFHGTLDAYKAAKRSLFSRLAVDDENPDKGFGKHAVINADDFYGADAFAVLGEFLAISAVAGHWGKFMPIAKNKGPFFNDLVEMDLEHTDPLTFNQDICCRVKIYKAQPGDKYKSLH